MIRMLAPMLAAAALAQAGPERSPEFRQYWKSGLAELSSYRVKTERYGEMRDGQAVLVFVYEEMNDSTRIKVESDGTPPERRVPILKLNHILKFNTGIYDYSIMTSVFAGLSGPQVARDFAPMKISMTAQEWCGHVYHQLEPRDAGLVSTLHSYFESEGNRLDTLPHRPGEVLYEDELPILLRELDGEFLEPGRERRVKLVQGLWASRKRHAPVEVRTASLRKFPKAAVTVPAGSFEAHAWTVRAGKDRTDYWVEAGHPRRLLKWETGRGEKGELVATRRKTYWKLNRNEHEGLRRELKLDFGAGGG